MNARRFALLLAAAPLAALPAAATQKTPAQLSTQVQSNFADNKTGAITPKILRDTTQDIVDSFAPLSSLVIACPSSQWIQSIATGGVSTCAQIGFSNLSGSISPTQIPYPSLTSIGGVMAVNPVANQFVTSINTSGVPLLAQPSFSNLSGTIAASQLIAPGASTFGAVKSSSAGANQFATGINTSGVVTYAQPAFSNLSGSIAASQLIAPGASTLGGVKSSSAPANQFATGIDTTGAVTYAQPTFSNLANVSTQLFGASNIWTAYQNFTGSIYAGGGYSSSQVGGWVNTIWPGSQYAVISPTFSSSVATGGGAGTFAARMSDTVGGGFGSIQSLRCLAYVDANPTVYPAWCGYVEGVLAAGTTGYYYGIENSIVSNWAAADIDPYSINTLNGTRGWRTSCGKGSGPTVTMCSAVMDVVQNPQVFRNGLVFASGWGDTTGGRIPAALVMPSGTGMQWYYGAGAPSWTLWATATGPGGFFALGNQAIDIYGAGAEAGTTYFHLSNTGSGELDAGASTGNYVALVGATAGTGSAVQAKGVDTNIDLRLIPKGSGKITANAAIALHSFISNGSAPTITGSGACTLGTQVGGSTSGKFTATAACATGQTYTISGMPAAINGYVCDAGDRTTSGVVFQQTSDSTTSAVLTVRTTGVSNADVIQFKCMGY